MDHFSPSYFALLGPLEQADLVEQVIPEPCVRILNALSTAGVRYMLAGNLALTLHGVPVTPVDLHLVVDPDGGNLQRFLETLSSESISPGEAAALEKIQDGEISSSFSMRILHDFEQQIRVLVKDRAYFMEAFERRVSISSGSLVIDLVPLEDLVLMKSGEDDQKLSIED